MSVRGFPSTIGKRETSGGRAAEKGSESMGFFRNMGNALVRFMYGRNGMDQLNRALLWLYLGICVVRMLALMLLHSGVVDLILEILLWAVLVVLLLRLFSRNLPKRRAENQRWVNWWWKVKNSSSASRARHADKEHKYFVCKNCKTICRVPVGKGKIIITCPKCGAQIHART